MGERRYTPVLPWVAKIQYGPNGEAAYAWVSANDGTLIGTFKTHHAHLVVRAVNRDALFNEAVEALEGCRTTLAMLTEPKDIRSTTVTHAWAQAVEAERKARAVLAKAREAGK